MKSLDDRIREELSILREYEGSEVMVRICGLLSLIEDSYKEQLADVAAGDLHKLQGALKQARCLRGALTGEPGISPLL